MDLEKLFTSTSIAKICHRVHKWSYFVGRKLLDDTTCTGSKLRHLSLGKSTALAIFAMFLCCPYKLQFAF